MLTTKYALKKNVREWITLAVCVVSCLFGISMVTKVRVNRITSSPDPTTNSETKNSNFSFFDRFLLNEFTSKKGGVLIISKNSVIKMK